MRGIKACSAALAMALLGKTDVAVYDGSWQEFSHRYVDQNNNGLGESKKATEKRSAKLS